MTDQPIRRYGRCPVCDKRTTRLRPSWIDGKDWAPDFTHDRCQAEAFRRAFLAEHPGATLWDVTTAMAAEIDRMRAGN